MSWRDSLWDVIDALTLTESSRCSTPVVMGPLLAVSADMVRSW